MLKQASYKLPVLLMREGDYFVAYTPALDLSVQGRTKLQVQQRFSEAVTLFLQEIDKMGTTDEVLEELGWVKQPHMRWQPPQVVSDAPQEFEVKVPAFA